MTLDSQHWTNLKTQQQRLKNITLRDLFSKNPDRFGQFSCSLDDLTIDFSKEKVDAEALTALVEFAKSADIEAVAKKCLAGNM